MITKDLHDGLNREVDSMMEDIIYIWCPVVILGAIDLYNYNYNNVLWSFITVLFLSLFMIVLFINPRRASQRGLQYLVCH